MMARKMMVVALLPPAKHDAPSAIPSTAEWMTRPRNAVVGGGTTPAGAAGACWRAVGGAVEGIAVVAGDAADVPRAATEAYDAVLPRLTSPPSPPPLLVVVAAVVVLLLLLVAAAEVVGAVELLPSPSSWRLLLISCM